MKSRRYHWFSRIVVLSAFLALYASRVDRLAAADPSTSTASPRLYLVGVGPGAPDLITLRAIDVIKKADVIFCTDGIKKTFADVLQGKEVIEGYWRLFPFYGKELSEVPDDKRPEAEKLAAKRTEFVAKVRQAVADGKTIAILDHGDPMIYGPWEWCLEEFEDLRPVVIPGVSSFNAGNAALRKGVTTSARTKAVILSSTDWPGKTDTIERLAAHGSTMVLFTMKAEFADFIKKLSVNYPPETPVAIVKYAGDPDKEEVVRGTLGTIQQQMGDDRLPFQYLIYVGEFLNHRYKEEKPAVTDQEGATGRGQE